MAEKITAPAVTTLDVKVLCSFFNARIAGHKPPQ
jgi:hypothetical protein